MRQDILLPCLLSLRIRRCMNSNMPGDGGRVNPPPVWELALYFFSIHGCMVVLEGMSDVFVGRKGEKEG